MKRSQMVRSIKNRLKYYAAKGYVFGDFRPEELSTQKLTAITKTKGSAFIQVVGEASHGSNVEQVIKLKAETRERQRLSARIERRARAYSEAGFGFADVSAAELEKYSLEELRKITRMKREQFIKEHGTSFTFMSGLHGTVKTTIPAELKLREEAALKKTRMYKTRHNIKEPIGIPYYTSISGALAYIEGIEDRSTKQYWSNRDEIWVDNWLGTLEDWSRTSKKLALLHKHLIKKPKSDILKVLREMSEIGIGSFTPTEYFDSHENNYTEDRVKELFNIFGLSDILKEYEITGKG